MENVFENFGEAIYTNSSIQKIQTFRRHAFVFMTAESDLAKGALEDLKKVEGVVELYISRGAYDIIAKVSGESLEHLREVVLKQIRSVGNIKSTLTLMVV